MILLKVRLISKERRHWKIRKLFSKSKDLVNTSSKWVRLLKDMKKGLELKRKTPKRSFKKRFQESNKRKKTLKLSMNKREKLLKNKRKPFRNLNLNSKERWLFKLKNMRIWRNHKRNLPELMKLKMKSSMSKLNSWILPFQMENLESENKLNIGKNNTMKLKELMLIFRVNLIRKKHFGKINSISTRNKRSKQRRIKKKLCFNSNQPLNNFKRPKMTPKTSIMPTKTPLLLKCRKSSKLKWLKLLKLLLTKSMTFKILLSSMKVKTRFWKKTLSLDLRTFNQIKEV